MDPKESITTEDILQISCWVSSMIRDENDPIQEISDEFIISYIMFKWEEEGRIYDVGDLCQEYSRLLTDFVLTRGVSKGILDVEFSPDGSISYQLIKKEDDDGTAET